MFGWLKKLIGLLFKLSKTSKDKTTGNLAKELIKRLGGVYTKQGFIHSLQSNFLWGTDYSKYLMKGKSLRRLFLDKKEPTQKAEFANAWNVNVNYFMITGLVAKLEMHSSEFKLQVDQIYSQVRRYSNEYFLTGSLTANKKYFLYNTLPIIPPVVRNEKAHKGKGTLKHPNPVKKKPQKPKDDGWLKANSSWIIEFRYTGERLLTSVGKLAVKMVRSKTIYTFPRFPFMEYVLLSAVTENVGTYWWEHYLWKYGIGRYTGFSNKKSGFVVPTKKQQYKKNGGPGKSRSKWEQGGGNWGAPFSNKSKSVLKKMGVFK